jgi:hypothetical protein
LRNTGCDALPKNALTGLLFIPVDAYTRGVNHSLRDIDALWPDAVSGNNGHLCGHDKPFRSGGLLNHDPIAVMQNMLIVSCF